MNLKWPGVIIEHSSCTVSKKHQLWTNTDVGRLRVPRRSRKLESDCNPNVFFFLLPLLLFHNESISPSYNRWNIPQRKKERKKERKKDRERENKRNQAPHTIAPTVFLFLILFFFSPTARSWRSWLFFWCINRRRKERYKEDTVMMGSIFPSKRLKTLMAGLMLSLNSKRRNEVRLNAIRPQKPFLKLKLFSPTVKRKSSWACFW